MAMVKLFASKPNLYLPYCKLIIPLPCLLVARSPKALHITIEINIAS
jgi:hypothetical protein